MSRGMTDRGRTGRRLPAHFWPVAVGIAGFALWCGWLILEVRALRASVAVHVGALQDVRAAADVAGKRALGSSAGSWDDVDARLDRVGREVSADVLGDDLTDLREAVAALRADAEAGRATETSQTRLIAAQSSLVMRLRVQTARESTALGDTWTSLYLVVAAALLLATANLALLVVAARRRRQAESRGAELAAQMRILEDAAGAIADGFIDEAIPNPDGSPFAATLERIRADLVDKITVLDARNQENEDLNRELRHQIGQRSRELEDALRKLHRHGPSRAAGSVFHGRYRIVDTIGTGSHGHVYRVERQPDGRELALKVLKRFDNDIVVERFVREAELLASIRHPNVIAVHDVGLTEDGELYLVTELVDGKSLREMTRHYGDAAWGAPILQRVASGLAAVHETGVIHRDIKPGNIVVPDAGADAKLIDFGIARLSSDDSDDSDAARLPSGTPDTEPFTRVGQVVGTPRFLAPEVVANLGEVSPASDVFALGVTAYEVLCGKRAFPQPPMMLVAKYGELPPPRPAALLNRSLGLDAGNAIMSSLDADPDARPTAAELAAALTA